MIISNKHHYKPCCFEGRLKKYLFCLFLFLLTVVISCSSEKKLAKQFINSKDTVNILLLKTDYIFKKNLKVKADTIPVSGNDSVGADQFEIIGSVNNKTLTDLLFTGIIDELKKRNFRIYTEDNMNAFMKLDSDASIFHLVQVELDELYTPYTASQMYDTIIYYEDFNLNTVSINLWFELSHLNSDDEKSSVLYSTMKISDKVDGYFRRSFLTNGVKFYYDRKNVSSDDVYTLALYFGENNAEYIYDYFLNRYVYIKYKGKKKLKFLHYDYKVKKISLAGHKRFIFM